VPAEEDLTYHPVTLYRALTAVHAALEDRNDAAANALISTYCEGDTERTKDFLAALVFIARRTMLMCFGAASPEAAEEARPLALNFVTWWSDQVFTDINPADLDG